MIFSYKDRLVVLGPVVQTSTDQPIYLQDTAIYSQNGTPYYTASFTGDPTLPTTIWNGLLLPDDQTAAANSWYEDVFGYGGFISAGRKREKELHQEFSAWRIEGEWFKNDGSVAEFAKSLSTDGDNQPEPKGGHMIYVKGAKMTLLTDAELARARALYRDGWTAGTIAFDVGLMTGHTISANTIERYAKRLGWRRASAYEQLLRRKMVK